MTATAERIPLWKLNELLEPYDVKLHEVVAMANNYLLVLDENAKVAAIVVLAGENSSLVLPSSDPDLVADLAAIEVELAAMTEKLEDGKTELDLRLESLSDDIASYSAAAVADAQKVEDAADTTKSGDGDDTPPVEEEVVEEDA